MGYRTSTYPRDSWCLHRFSTKGTGSVSLCYSSTASIKKLRKSLQIYFSSTEIPFTNFTGRKSFPSQRKLQPKAEGETSNEGRLGCTIKQEQSLVLEKSLYTKKCFALRSQELDKAYLLSPVSPSHISANKGSFCLPVGPSKAFCQNFF